MSKFFVALVGNSNCGKTTLFNALTGLAKGVGNWAGVTVDKNQGSCQKVTIPFEVVDLPGISMLQETIADLPQDEQIAHHYIYSGKMNLIVNVVDATQLERQIFLTQQLLSRFPDRVLVVLNMMDEAKRLGIDIDTKALSFEWGCPVIPITAQDHSTLPALKTAIVEQIQHLETSPCCQKISLTGQSCETYSSHLKFPQASFQSIHTLLNKARKIRYSHVNHQIIDKWVLNRYFAIPFFFLLMYCMFGFTINMGGMLQALIDPRLKWLFIEAPTLFLSNINTPPWLSLLITQGLGQGIATTLNFIPIIATMFLCLSLLEGSGYMARAAFVMDRIMQWVGLSGRAFVPLILGFGCNVPAILGTRTLENPRERILTILMSPFMSCGARLAIYALFVASFFNEHSHNIIFALYLIGIAVALMTGFLLRTVLISKSTPFILELPPYRWPNMKQILLSTRRRVKSFVLKAGVVIVPLSILLTSFSAFKGPDQESWLTHISKGITPIFSPLGIQNDNWQATVGLITGIMAKEVVVGTLNTLYDPETGNDISEKFGGPIAAFSYLLFVLLYFPCVSVLATIARELSTLWSLFTVVWTTTLAYAVSVIFYQSATLFSHPKTSLLWIGAMNLLLWIGFKIMRKWLQFNLNKDKNKRPPLPTHILITN